MIKTKVMNFCNAADKNEACSQQGFTLVEISIALVIIGLLVGGALVGSNMIRGSELKTVMNDLNTYKVAINNFRLKYNAVPGDMKNAEAYWGQAAAGSACKITVGAGTETCNGDGDGYVETVISPSTSREDVRFWQHLANAELIQGVYTGVHETGSAKILPGKNAPKLPLGDHAGIVVISLPEDAGYSRIDLVSAKNIFLVGAWRDASSNLFGPVLSPFETHTVDLKLDDGDASTGYMIARGAHGVGSSCLDGDDYNNDFGDERACIFYYSIGK